MRQSLRAQAKSAKKSDGAAASAARWTLASAGVLFLAWAVLFPALAGSLGRFLSDSLGAALGGARFLLPLLTAHALLRRWRLGKEAGGLVVFIASTASLAALACLLSLGSAVWSADGGALGGKLAGTLQAGLGAFGASTLSFLGLLLSLQIAVGIKWGRLAIKAGALIAEDWKNWRDARTELERRVAQAPRAKEAVVPRKAEPSSNGNGAVAAPARATPQEINEAVAKKARPAGEPARVPAPPPPDSPYANYQLPPLSLLKPPPPSSERGRPPQSEIDASIAHLEATLKSFDVEAHVTGYAPGPVITRYELSPASGVKVSSIVALENDLALAMKAKGIRIIAPIPGKAAVGIEIPNAKPAMVVLRDILESEAIPAGAPLLTFGLGLSAAGEPRSADISKMPHVLVAGATNSGKSVMIHAMILSILFRARPDEVKFLMIDPKRLELTFYDGIPHLFDPTASPDKVTVATNPKEAAKSLIALVRLMEKRYEKFQLFSVRNIEGYNAEADKRGQPREFYIVVIIDELADLMLIMGDQVEDAIQRLTQMARAVGIHLVLATQRPSVDVITGVIKANLPARLALQVISKVDSKVILDTQGAESLQGRGDLLYLAAGAQKPERCQGAFVSEDEIRAVAAYLKTQGKPHYPMLETMAVKGAADDLASLGVEPLEFSQALKLVLERRRVSQDLLKSQFGSSARATNILSALEVKELIHKPEGSNRWEIHFDAIEDYMRAHFPQVPLDGRP